MSQDRKSPIDARRSLPQADYPLQDLTRRIISAFFYVHTSVGFGCLESVYRKALAVELRHRGILVEQLVRYEMFHRQVSIGIYEADLVAEQSVILETKTGLVLDPVALVQTLTYLKASHLPLGLVLHFGPRAQVKRVILSRRYSTTGVTSVGLKRGSRHDDTNHDAR